MNNISALLQRGLMVSREVGMVFGWIWLPGCKCKVQMVFD